MPSHREGYAQKTTLVGIIVLICGQVQLPYVAMTKTRRAKATNH